MKKRMDKIISFLKEIEKYKIIERKMYDSNLNRIESDAEHSWHLAMFIFLFQKELSKNVDFIKMLKLALMHDLVEIYAGDTFAYDKKSRSTKKERELKSAKRLFSQLPKDLETEFFKLYNEFETMHTKEAKIVNSFDKIQPILQNICSKGKSWKEHKITAIDIDNYKKKDMEHSLFIMKLYKSLLEEAKVKKMIK